MRAGLSLGGRADSFAPPGSFISGRPDQKGKAAAVPFAFSWPGKPIAASQTVFAAGADTAYTLKSATAGRSAGKITGSSGTATHFHGAASSAAAASRAASASAAAVASDIVADA